MKVVSAWIQKAWPLIGILLLVMVGGFMLIQTIRANKYYDKYLVSEGDFQAKNTAYLELKEDTDREKAILARERDEEAQGRAERDREINRIRAAGRKQDAELGKAKAKIKELSPDQLTNQLNSRVPTEFGLLASGEFSLSRRGGEATLSLFMDGERCVLALSERDSEIEEYKIKEISFNKDMDNFKIDLKSTEKLVSDCDKARLAAITSKENLEKAFKAMKWKQFGKGAVGGGVLVVVILKVAGVI